MSIETLGSIGDFVGGLAAIASLLYLAVQIRQNTRAIRSSSHHQAAEQTWNYCLARLTSRPGPPSRRRLVEIESRAHLHPPGAA